MSSASSRAKPRVQVFESTLGQYGKGAPFVGSHNVRTTTAVTAVTTRSRYPPGPTSQTHTPIRTACVPTMGRDPLTKMVTVVITVTVLMAAYLGGTQLYLWISHNLNSPTTRTPQGWPQEQCRRL
jgi:hypothetical protein